jgi:hypothetical protein
MTERVIICVQGQLFSLTKELILDHDWMVAKILTSGVPFDTVDGRPYIDVDPVSFRMIVCILQGGMKMDGDLVGLSSPELALLRATARYLNCGSIEEAIDGYIKTKSNDLGQAIRTRNARVKNYESDLSATIAKCEKKESRLEARWARKIEEAENENTILRQQELERLLIIALALLVSEEDDIF